MNSYTQVKQKEKILIFTNAYPNNIDINLGLDIQTQVVGLANSFDIKVIAPIAWFPCKSIILGQKGGVVKGIHNSNIEIFYPRYFVIPKVGRWLYGIFYLIATWKLVGNLRKEFRFNLIISYWTYPDGFAAVLFAKKFKVPVIIRPRGSDINILPHGWIRRKIIRYTLKKADVILPVCEDLKNKIIKLGIEADKIKVITLGIDTQRFTVQEKKKSREKIGIDNGACVLLFIGALRDIKGINYLIEAMNILWSRKSKNIRLNIIGSGPLRKKLENLVAEYELKERVKFIGDVVNAELPKWINSADLFCLPSKSEGWPNVIMESLACGVPVVASKVGGIPEIINDNKYGLLVDSNNPEKLAAAIERALCEKWDREDLAGRVKNYSWQNIINQLSLEINQVLDS